MSATSNFYKRDDVKPVFIKTRTASAGPANLLAKETVITRNPATVAVTVPGGAPYTFQLENGLIPANFAITVTSGTPLLVPGASSPADSNSDILYSPRPSGNASTRVRHVVSGVGTARSIGVAGADITVNVATTPAVAATGTLNALAYAGWASGDNFSVPDGTHVVKFEVRSKEVHSITFPAKAACSNNQTVIVNDGIHAATTFEAEVVAAGWNPTGGSVIVVDITAATTAQTVASAFLTAINAVGATLAVVASTPTLGVMPLNASATGTLTGFGVTGTLGGSTVTDALVASGKGAAAIGGATAIDITSTVLTRIPTQTETATTIIAAINAVVAGLTVTASPSVPADAIVHLTNDATGVAGNVAITNGVASGLFTPTGMSGGSAGGVVAATETAVSILGSINADASASLLVFATLPGTGTGANLVKAVAYGTIPAGVNQGGAFFFGAMYLGDIQYYSNQPGNDAIKITHVVTGLNTPRSIVVTGSAIVVNIATDGAGAVSNSETAYYIAEAVNNSPAASNLVYAVSIDGGLVAAQSITSVTQGVCTDDLITIANYTQITSIVPGASQFSVNYNTGLLTFNSANAGASLSATYNNDIATAPIGITAISTLAGVGVKTYGTQVRPIDISVKGQVTSGYRNDFYRMFNKA